jgi:hypothetical protein
VRQRDRTGIDDTNVAHVNAQRAGHRLALDPVGVREHLQEHLPAQVRQARGQPIVEAALLGHEPGQILELPACGRHAPVLVAHRAANQREHDVERMLRAQPRDGTELIGAGQDPIAVDELGEQGRDRGIQGGLLGVTTPVGGASAAGVGRHGEHVYPFAVIPDVYGVVKSRGRCRWSRPSFRGAVG